MSLVTKQQRKNLFKLMKYLANYHYREDRKFDMTIFTEQSVFEKTCGTVGCAVGHGPYAGIKKKETENFFSYSKRCFVSDYFGIGNCWLYLFSDNWGNVDNTTLGAAKRIYVILTTGKVPQSFQRDYENYSNDSYKNVTRQQIRDYIKSKERINADKAK